MNATTSMSLGDFSRVRLLVVGDVMLDRYWFGDASRISPEAPVPVVKIERSEERPGGAANLLTSRNFVNSAKIIKIRHLCFLVIRL